jgi:putative hydrolase of the HAD superfamily
MTGTPVRAVFFDAVGTLIHPQPPAEIVYAEIGGRFGIEADPRQVRQLFWEAFARQEQLDRAAGWKTSEKREIQRWRTIVGEALRGASDADACFAALYEHFSQPSHWQCTANAKEVISAILARGCKVGMASNFDKRLHRVMAGQPALAGVQHVVISSEVGCRKPAAEFFAAVAKAAAVPLQEILYVGDHLENDSEAAKAVGCRALHLDPSGRSQQVPNAVSKLEAVVDYLSQGTGC